MRIVLDTKSESWRIFRKWSIVIIIWIVVMILTGAVGHHFNWDTDFFVGYFTCFIFNYSKILK